MSADNGIFIAKFTDGYRVAHGFMSFVMDIDEEEDIEKRKEKLKYLFERKESFSNYEHAKNFAIELSDNYDYLEYDIQYMGEYNFSLGENIMEEESKFWIVVNKNFPTRVSYKHWDENSASDEAKRLARQNAGTEFVVMEAVESYVVNDLVRKVFVDEIPF